MHRNFIQILSDLIVFFFVFGLSYWIRFYSKLFLTFPDHDLLNEYLITILLISPVYLFFLAVFEIFHVKLVFSKKDMVISRVKAVSLTLLVFFSLSFFIRSISYSRLMFIFVWLLLIIFSVFIHFFLIKILPFPNILFLIRKNKLNEIKDTNFNILKDYYYPIPDKINNKEIENIIVEKNAQLVYILLEDFHSNDILDIFCRLNYRGVQLSLIPSLFINLPLKLELNNHYDILNMHIQLSINNLYNRILKRIFDLLVIIISFPIVAPLFILLIIILYLNQKKIFYIQERIGKDNKRFLMYKFQTMKEEAEKETGPVWAKENDNRVTTIGKYLRKTSLDELPQLLNILKGEMSFIGPRPERPFFVEKFASMWSEYLQRHQVKPGLSGWAQVNGLRGQCSVKKRLYYDLYYIYHFSWFLEMKIIIRTIMEFLFHKKAY